MKKISLIFLTLVVLILGAYFFIPEKKAKSVVKSLPAAQKSVTVVSIPTTIIIPSLNVDAKVESVGMDNRGAMDTPKDSNNAAWYNLGSKPGDNGSAVIAAHLDKEDGSPAVFWDIKKLNEGDRVEVIDDKSIKHSFKVEKVIDYNFDEVPLKEIFAASDGIRRLNLITCGGQWDKSSKNYSKRTVAYTTGI